MSGPIVRKYGFPNFEKIFGERELKHGAEGQAEAPADSQPATGPTRPPAEPVPSEADPKPPKP